ncbi:MAG: serine/threonine protein kinase [Planctomycetes bacterium]|nr:serine/threonine protein kinase [Planctomycetota bacterium]
MTAKAAPSCLSESMLRDLIAGEIDDRPAGEARKHLETCAACSARQAAIQSELESWVAELRAAGPPRLGGELPRHTERDQAIAQLLAGYQIIEEIGRGGQGIVYRALQVSTHREVALKVLREGPFASRDERRRFEREVELVAGLNHPCIVTVFDSGEMRDGRPYCVMDLVDGLPIDQYLEQSKCTLAELIRLFADVCDGVNYAHQRGVIHRDIKPSNILVDSLGRPRILDFGLAKTMNRTGRSVVTAEGLVAGTIPYLAPEQAQGRAQDIDIRTDVYGLGIVFYRLLYGDFPYPVDSDLSAVLRHIAETPPVPRVIASQFSKFTPDLAVSRFITDELSTIVSKSLAKSRERRYQTAGDFGADLRRVLSNEPIEARRDSRLYLLRSLLRRHRRAATAAIAFVAVILASVVALGVMYGRQSRLLERVREEKSKAEAAETRATRRFGELRELTRSFIFDLDRMLSNVAGAVPAREFIVQNAMKYLNSLAEDMSDEDPQKLAELTAAHFALGDILGDPQTNSLGRPAEAIVHYMRGIESIEALLRQKPDDSKTMVGLWTGYRRAALMLTTLDRAEESHAFHVKAGKLMERMIQLFPDDPSVLRNKIYAMRRGRIS